ncbi:uncharacterized protein LOC116306312 [Actinia tenebrosa]|uniref:Uncharacterized protein LOC116306312 n=1 Tax=Actinia tenebrosa TaxID=6105 RepID=A0A6P8J3P4_ACTTE|nr:uncharacterized protein LOC116306312 [Actinia tenebrosa]
MQLLPVSLVCLTLTTSIFLADGGTLGSTDYLEPQIREDTLAELKQTVESLKTTVGSLTRQMILQQLFVEERVRSDADSGVKQVRHVRDGTQNYHSQSHGSATRLVAIHDHSNNDRTVGLGEFVAVLNGVEFRTRHNDYRLYMPHRTSKELHAVEDIPFPDVPPEVTSKKTVSLEIEEMREWFKAWKDQDYSVRDYRKYFKPVLCYLEGAWTAASEGKIDEPFESDRHFVDASSWFDLQEKVRFTSYAGRKDNLENFSFLPTAVMNITDEDLPEFAQWNYRILCHPLSRDVPLNRLRVVDEVAPRMAGRRTYDEHSVTRAARFQLNPYDEDKFTERFQRAKFGLLDELMAEIPGQDNYPGELYDDAFGLTAYSLAPEKQDQKLRADRYHRWFRVAEPDAMGTSIRHRAFADQNLFMAMNTQPKVRGMTLNRCKGEDEDKVCNTWHQKWSYAIPLEIIYLTPLSKWNPYDIEFKGKDGKGYANTVTANGRNGDLIKEKAFNGTNSRKFYRTPMEFFAGNEVEADAADTTKNSVGVLDKKGDMRICKATGTRIFFPPIGDLGILRQRYPIMPIHGEGSAVWKELNALKDMVLKSKTNGYIFREPLQSGPAPTEPPNKDTRLQVQLSTSKVLVPHTHEILLTSDEVSFAKAGGLVNVISSTASAHEHSMAVKWSKSNTRFVIQSCDSSDTGAKRCWDLHPAILVIMPDQ